MDRRRLLYFRLSIFSVLGAPLNAAEFTISKSKKVHIKYSPFNNQDFPQTMYWGDTHLHTTY